MKSTSVRSGEIGKVVLGCGVVAVVGLLICGGLAAYLIPQMMDKGVALIQKELERQRILENWTPPTAEATAEELLPEQVGNYTRSTAPDETAISDLNVEKTFHHAVYASGGEEFTVYIDQASADERTLVFTHLKDKLDNHQGGTKLFFGSENSSSFYYHYDPPGVTGTAYYGKGWLVLFSTDGEGDSLSTFAQTYLDAIEGEPVAAAEEPEPAIEEPEPSLDTESEATPETGEVPDPSDQ